MSKKPGKLIIVSAPSGAGKTTLVHHLLSEIPDLEFSVSCATRKPRENETEGKDYYFISAEAFKERIKNNEFAEWEEVYKDNFYGTLKAEIQRILDKGHSVIFDIDVKGGINLKKLYPEDSLSIFIMPPTEEELERRLRNRKTETENQLKMRIGKAKRELALADQFDQILVNDNLKESKSSIVHLVNDFIKD